MEKEWHIDIAFNEDDVKNQLPEELYSYIVERQLIDKLAEIIISATEHDINENFSEVVGANMKWAAEKLIWMEIKP